MESTNKELLTREEFIQKMKGIEVPEIGAFGGKEFDLEVNNSLKELLAKQIEMAEDSEDYDVVELSPEFKVRLFRSLLPVRQIEKGETWEEFKMRRAYLNRKVKLYKRGLYVSKS